jgi:hypothetical protein
MTGFKQPDFLERQDAAIKAKKVALEKFRANAADPALADRLTARTARADERKAVNTMREKEKADKKARDSERAQQAEHDAAIEAKRAEAERADRESALETGRKTARDVRYAARKSRLKRR